ncbi:MAG: hypothetical protein CSB33_00665 [Desulfobacterales bacterium]|nr:MAG: hypothetical protein CSB33_00665 [Desulfobacterales bacterium]
MLKILREKAGSWFIKVILGAIVIVFIFWGVGSFKNRQMSAAIVNGDLISLEEYHGAFNRMVDQYRLRFGDRWDESMIHRLNLKEQTLKSLINLRLMEQEAIRMNFFVTDRDLVDEIQRMPEFQRNGAFNSGKYRQVLAANRLSPEDFEQMQRKSMLVDRFIDYIHSSAVVSGKEVEEWYQWNNAERVLDWVKFTPEDFQDTDLTEEEIQKYYDENTDKYKTEKQVKAQYLVFKTGNFMQEDEVTEEDVSEYYASHTAEFREEKEVKARHILLKLAENAAEEEIAAKRDRLMEIKAEIDAGKDFAKSAKEVSEGPSKTRGGDLGFFKRGIMVKPFADKAFSMNAGDVSEPVRTRFGWHLIKVEEIKEEKIHSLDESAGKIRKQLAEETAQKKALETAENFRDGVYSGDDLKKSALPDGMEVREEDFFTAEGPADMDAKVKSRFAAAAFSLGVMEISEIKEISGDYYIIQPVEVQPEERAPYETVKDDVKKDALLAKGMEKAGEAASRVLTSARSGESLGGLLEPYDKELAETAPFKRGGPIPGIGYERDILSDAFMLTEEAPYPARPVEGRGGIYVYRLNKVVPADMANFEKDARGIRERLMQQKKSRLVEEWVAQKKAASTIRIQDGVI